ncbi:hypothetical protein ACQR1I_36730 [Bradyrhizobium sp. HKCCYLS2038]|uniref:hypothetical protein n=1 Tax=Bradyrhizobium sp. HKCCYLS2038 TaxID=3420764 RepID=UPI003EB9D4A2
MRNALFATIWIVACLAGLAALVNYQEPAKPPVSAAERYCAPNDRKDCETILRLRSAFEAQPPVSRDERLLRSLR